MNDIENKIFKTELLCLKDIVDYNFIIPTYQRPYVWGDEQLKKLIDDFYKSFIQNPNENYYISTIITKDNGVQVKSSELIDGQQRFTTLWLISFVFYKLTKDSEQESDIIKFLKTDNKIRLSFEIRDEVYGYLNALLENSEIELNKYIQKIEFYPYLKHIANALNSIESFIKDVLSDYTEDNIYQQKLVEFGNFIYSKVYFIKNTTPPNTDLNKLFSTINNSGVQLEQTDIVKANLLRLVDNKVMYSKIWETCENMNNFFERNARTAFPVSNWQNINLIEEFEFDETKFNYVSDSQSKNEFSNNKAFDISEITDQDIADYNFDKQASANEDNRKSDEIYCRSIINFPQLLLHTYRIHLKAENLPDFEGTFHANRLIEVFKKMERRNNKEEIQRFFIRLWKVRYLFDEYIIKWISDTNTKIETFELVNFSKNIDGYYSRTPYEKSNSLMLQSVLYFTGDYLRQYWLSSYLDYLLYHHGNKIATNSEHLACLEYIDNVLSLNKNVADKELSWQMMTQTDGFDNNFDFNKYLSKPLGTGFKHYWFYKLEYLLWKNWEKRDNEKLKNYRITSKNSIEHVFPQHHEFYKQVDKDLLNSFGNLVLLSVSENSSYSNQDVKKKKVDFDNKPICDSLKLAKIFSLISENNWNEDMIKKHQEEMIEIINNHYNSFDDYANKNGTHQKI